MSKFGANICTDVCSRRLSVLRCEQFFGSKAQGKLRASRNRMQRYQRSIDTVYYVTNRIPLNNGLYPKRAAFEISVFSEARRKFGDFILMLKYRCHGKLGPFPLAEAFKFYLWWPTALDIRLPYETRKVARDNSVILWSNPHHQTSYVSPLIDNRSNMCHPRICTTAKFDILGELEARRGVPFLVGDIRPSG